MNERTELIRKNIIKDLNEGVLVLGFDGAIEYANQAVSDILGISFGDLERSNFARTLIAGNDNDQFIQTILDAIYNTEVKHYNIVPYRIGAVTRQLYVMTSFLKEGDTRIGIIVIISDITELAELKIEYANSITALLDSLVKALSTAIDERSPYTANHARNMVKIAEAFIDYLEESRDPRRFDEDRRRAFLMSTWLHDVGKLAVPLEVMDKATRLGDKITSVEDRFERIRLLDRIAFLEGKISEEEWKERNRIREEDISEIRRLDKAGFINNDDLKTVERLASSVYCDEQGNECPLLNEDEIRDLQIRKGTLTEEERKIIQSHVTTTGKILNQVEFPKIYSVVPMWAASHHEFLNGTGYPNKLKGDEIPFEVRLLTIIDIYETLTARDRPYKKPIPPEKSLEILHNMAEEGNLDKELLDLFEKSGAWKAVVG